MTTDPSHIAIKRAVAFGLYLLIAVVVAAAAYLFWPRGSP